MSILIWYSKINTLHLQKELVENPIKSRRNLIKLNMASLNNLYLKLETLETLVKGIKAKGENGISIDISINDEANQYNKNVSAYVTQSKDDRENKKPRYYVGNGRTFWTDGTITAFKNESNDSGKDVKKELESSEDILPF